MHATLLSLYAFPLSDLIWVYLDGSLVGKSNTTTFT